jgi:hypothetical protein
MISNTVGYTAVSSCSQVSTEVYKISVAATRLLGAYYIVNLCSRILKGRGAYVSTSTAPYVRVLDGNNNLSSSGFTYMLV